MSGEVSSPDACARCKSAQPPAARFCYRCGRDHLDTRPIEDRRSPVANERARHYVVRPNERVRSFNVVTALLPLSNGQGVRAYDLALAIGVVIPVVAAAIGWVPFAIVAAALAVPVVFTIYLYDVNEWDDQPVPVVLGTIVASGVLGAAAIRLVDGLLLDASDRVGLGRLGLGDTGIDSRYVVVIGVVAPLVAVILGLAGPLWLATRPRFDDMIDGLTFGAVSGAAYAAGETLMMHRGILGADAVQRGDAVLWMSIVANAAVVKPIVYGSAIAIAGAAFSGIGPGFEGLRKRFAKGVTIAAVGVVAYGVGVSLLDDIDGWAGAALGLAWGAVVALALIVVVRTQLHLGILEAALEAAQGRPNRHEVVAGSHCGECDMFLAPLALFCSACGTSVRATSKVRQHANVRRPVAAGSGPQTGATTS